MPSLRHLRRSVAPWWWPIPRKRSAAGGVWTVKPMPGPHSLARSLPLGILIRDVFHYARTMREARMIIGSGKIRVDGRVRRNYKFPVGLMDVIEIVPTGEIYRMVPHPVKFLWPVPISQEEARFKPLRVEGKTAVKGGRLQLHFHDGRNLILPPDEARKYATFDTVLLDLQSNQIVKHVPFRLGVDAVVFDGRNVGSFGRVVEVIWALKRRRSTVALQRDSEVVRTILDYIMPRVDGITMVATQ